MPSPLEGTATSVAEALAQIKSGKKVYPLLVAPWNSDYSK